MANVMDYIKKYGDISFCDMPFGEADNVALCGMYYMPFDKVVSDRFEDEPVDYKTASDEIFELRGRKHTPVGLAYLHGNEPYSVPHYPLLHYEPWPPLSSTIRLHSGKERCHCSATYHPYTKFYPLQILPFSLQPS